MWTPNTTPDPVGRYVDAILQAGYLKDRPEDERARTEAQLRRVASIYVEAATAVRAAVESRELTRIGIMAAVKRALTKATDALKEHDTTLERLRASAAETRSRALAAPDGERTTETLMLEREVRDRLAGQDPRNVGKQYVEAIDRGDSLFVSAIERAPAAFPLIDDVWRRAGEDRKVARSPLAPEILQLEAESEAYNTVVDATRRSLTELAAGHDVHE